MRWDRSLLQLSVYRERDRNGSKDSWIPGAALPPTGHCWHHSSPECSQPSSPHCYLPPFSGGAACWLQQQIPLPPKLLRLVSSVDPCLLQRIEYNFFRMDYIYKSWIMLPYSPLDLKNISVKHCVVGAKILISHNFPAISKDPLLLALDSGDGAHATEWPGASSGVRKFDLLPFKGK